MPVSILNLEAYTRQQPHLPHVNLPYPHIFTTPRSRRPTTTTPTPSTPPNYNPAAPTTTSLFEKLAAPFTSKFEKTPDHPQELMHTKPNLSHQKSSEDLSKTCDNCQPDKQCILKLKSFETTDPAFQYAYSHGTALSDLLDAVMRETQTTNIPQPWTWKSTATPEVVQLTTSLMNLYKPNRSLVIGVFTGLALLGVATVTDSRGIVIGLEYPEYVHLWEKVGMKHAQRAGIMSRIQVRSLENVDKALTKLAAYEPNAFDFIFINELRKINLLDDYEHAVRLLRTNGLLIITDAFENGAVISSPEFSHSEGRQIVQAMNSRIKTDPRVSASLLPYGGGTWIIVKN
uniref:O-methyltransferase n=1 Tax=Panagrolaimus sp. JU765 TaxID=591449 RepID=A0AC34QH88_9BILA